MNIVSHTYRYTHRDIELHINTVVSAFKRIRE